MQIAGTAERDTEIASISALIAGGQGVLLTGPVGVGKSHLANVIAAQPALDDWHVVRLSGGPAIQTVHLGAVQPLLSRSMSRTPDELFTNAELELRSRAGAGSTLLVVDDVNQVDPASAALLRQLASDGITQLATVRDDAASDPFVLGLWTDGLLERVDIAPLTAQDSHDLVDELLPGGTSSAVHSAVFALAAGNPLFTRELIADGRQSGALVEDTGGWQLTGPLRAEQRVSDLFVARLGSLDPVLREALEAVALAERLPVAVAQDLASNGSLEQLEQAELIEVIDGMVHCSHPMLAEVVRREVPSLRSQRLVTELIDAILASPKSSPSDVLRAVRWQLDRGETPDPAVAAAAAQSALSIFDGPTAVDCAQAAFAPDSAPAHALLGRAQFIAQDLPAAVETLRRGRELAVTDADIALTAVALSEALAFGTGDFMAASTILDQSLASITEAPHRAMVAGTLSLVCALIGDFGPALTYGDELLDSPEIDARARLNLSLMWTIAAASSGRTEETQQRLDVSHELARELRAFMPAALDQSLGAQLLFDVADGRLGRARALGTEQRRAAERESRFTGMWDQTAAIIELLGGQGSAAVEHVDLAVASVATRDPLGIEQLALSVQAMVRAATGDVAGAMSAHDLSLADPRCGPREQAFLARARGGVLALQGDVDSAVTELRAGAANSGDGFVWAAWALYDGVRFDRAGDVAEELSAIAAKAPVETVLAMNDHCEALVAGDATLQGKAAERFARAGLALFAAEAAAHASRQLAVDCDETGAALMALHSLAFFDECDGVRSLAVEALERPLTDREYEVARAAASGKASQKIADELFVSRRTVDNHLQNSYRKLGIGQRDELRDVLIVDLGG